MIKMPRMVAESSSAKKAKVASAAESGASEVTVTLDSKLLECPVCCCPLVPPLFQCDDGHITCLGCCKHLKYDCSLCGEPADTRCHALENIISGMTVRCSFREHGCTDMFPFTEKLVHESSCRHAPCYCPIAGCRPYARRSLLDHINLEHPAVAYTNVTAGDLCPVPMQDGEPARFVALAGRGAIFLLVVDRSVPSGLGLSVIHVLSEASMADDFKYKIQVRTRRGILCLSGQTQSVMCLSTPYRAEVAASLFVSEDVWYPEDSPVYIELR